MTWSLKLENGDLAFNGASLAVVDNENKMIQDLTCQLLERMGHDDMHPEYGSLIDGGETVDGIVYESIVADDDLEMVKMRIQAEIIRIVNDYQGRQLDRAKADKMLYGKQSLTPREIVSSVNAINFVESLDHLIVNISISTTQNQQQTIELNLAK
jgi:hypothetical protein